MAIIERIHRISLNIYEYLDFGKMMILQKWEIIENQKENHVL